ncbi:uncharacterized protein [Argopecten irradians]|uniref:uncharacterized protein n=1 Tax=Argopecten irradians TaxID=31199 RepID=UPI00371968CB
MPEKEIRSFFKIPNDVSLDTYMIQRLESIMKTATSVEQALFAIQLDCAAFCDGCYFCGPGQVQDPCRPGQTHCHIVDPTHKLTFLGIEIDSLGMHLRLPDEKLHALKYELDNFSSRCRASKKQLQSLIGKLNWASSVVYGGRVFLRRLINAMSSLKKDSHKLRFNAEVLRDLAWWHTFLQTFNGKSLLLEKRAVTSIYTDACDEGAGGHWGNDWFYTNWSADIPTSLHMHINEKEVLAVCLAAHYWAPAWANKRIIVFSDNMVTVSSINKCTSRNSTVMHFLRYLFWLSARFNFHLSSTHIKGKHNCLADCVSRRYIAFLSMRLQFSSIRNYLSVVMFLHLEVGLTNPVDNFHISRVLKGARRLLGDSSCQKLPITPIILMQILPQLDIKSPRDISFWAACLVAFFSFFRKSNLSPLLEGF